MARMKSRSGKGRIMADDRFEQGKALIEEIYVRDLNGDRNDLRIEEYYRDYIVRIKSGGSFKRIIYLRGTYIDEERRIDIRNNLDQGIRNRPRERNP